MSDIGPSKTSAYRSATDHVLRRTSVLAVNYSGCDDGLITDTPMPDGEARRAATGWQPS